MRYASQEDGNQKEIVEELRARGYDVDEVFRLKRLYDLVVSGIPVWAEASVALRVEIKMPGKKLTPDEEQYWNTQRHNNLIIATTAQDVLDWFEKE